jgi:hypothetical protein
MDSENFHGWEAVMQCRAKSKRSQVQCKRHVTPGRDVCHYHGGAIPRGFGLPQTKTGKYSKVLPVKLAQRYDEALGNPQLLSLREDIATAEARLMDLFTRVDSGESGSLWKELRETFDAFEQAQATGDMAGMNRHWATTRQLVRKGSDDYAAWSEIYRVWEARCRLTNQEAKTLLSLQQVVTIEQLTTMFGVITDCINRSVLAHAPAEMGQTILGAIAAEFDVIARKEAEA